MRAWHGRDGSAAERGHGAGADTAATAAASRTSKGRSHGNEHQARGGGNCAARAGDHPRRHSEERRDDGDGTVDRISAAQSLGNFNNTLGEGTTLAGFNGASLRGLGTQRTLVLLNGRRVAPYALSNTSSPSAAGADLNAIPLSAIERIEVLKDGASAVYGADAVGGVINFILRKDYQGAEATFSYLDSEHGGGATRRLNGTAGWGDLATQKFNAFLTRLPEPRSPARFGSRNIQDSVPASIRRGPHLGQHDPGQHRPERGRLRTQRDGRRVLRYAQSGQPGVPAAVLVPDHAKPAAVPLRLRGDDRHDPAERPDQRPGQVHLADQPGPSGVPRGVVLPRRLHAAPLADADLELVHDQPGAAVPELAVLPGRLRGEPRRRQHPADPVELSGARIRTADRRAEVRHLSRGWRLDRRHRRLGLPGRTPLHREQAGRRLHRRLPEQGAVPADPASGVINPFGFNTPAAIAAVTPAKISAMRRATRPRITAPTSSSPTRSISSRPVRWPWQRVRKFATSTCRWSTPRSCRRATSSAARARSRR